MKTGHAIRIILADDHAMMREGLRSILESELGYSVIAQAGNGRETVQLVKSHAPDLVIMDISMPGLNGIEATRQILQAAPETRVLVLSAHSDQEYVDRFFALGAAGYVLKQSSLADLAEAIRVVHSGRRHLGPSIAFGDPAGEKAVRAPLTVREAEVLQMIAEGRANKQTAAALGISIKTVEKHRQSLMTKLGIHDVAGLTRYAISIGVIEGREAPPAP